MKTRDDISRDVEAFVTAHYYSESDELKWAIKDYEEQLARGERDLLKQVMLARLTEDPSIVNVVLISCWEMPEAVPILISMLDDEAFTSQRSRAIMSVLQHCRDENACRAVERFLDSEQEGEALTFLARMDFVRSTPRLKQALKKKHLSDVCLHILAERYKHVGLTQLAAELRERVTGSSEYFLERVTAVLNAKTGDFSPFSAEEVRALTGLLAEDGE